MATKRRYSAVSPVVEEPVDPADEFMFLCLGGGMEVGRSCHIIQYKGKTVMVGAYIFNILLKYALTGASYSSTLACTLRSMELLPYPGSTNSILVPWIFYS
jgi:hypothetical protein